MSNALAIEEGTKMEGGGVDDNELARISEFYRLSNGRNVKNECLGFSELEGIKVLTLRGTDSEKTVTVDLDAESLLPVRIIETGKTGEIEAIYRYKNLHLNVAVVHRH